MVPVIDVQALDKKLKNKDDFILILAGYKDDIQQYILNNNQ